MANIDAIGVPFDGSGRVGNQADAAIALRRPGLVSAFEGHDAAIEDVTPPAATSARGAATSLINEAALLAMTAALNGRVGRWVGAGRFPFVYGGDTGLVFIDGHEDTMPLDASEDGEAANAQRTTRCDP